MSYEKLDPILDSEGNQRTCVICGASMTPVFTHQIMRKYEATYLHCQECEFIQVDNPHWLDEAYARPITEQDIGLLQRNIRYSQMLTPIFYKLFGLSGKYVDAAGGYGIFTRLMRDIGFDFFHSDRYCENLFARHFEASSGEYAAVTAFEVMEHTPDPIDFLEKEVLLYHPDVVVFSTLRHSGEPPSEDWHYYAFETGQHIAFYSKKTLNRIANRLNMHYLEMSDHLHVFTNLTEKSVKRSLKSSILPLSLKLTKRKLRANGLRKLDVKKVRGL